MGTKYLKNMQEMLNDRTTAYLNSTNYRDVLQLLMTEYLIAVSQARQAGDELEDCSQFMINMLLDKIQRRDESHIPVDDDLRAVSMGKTMAYQQSSDVKWNKRPTSAFRPHTAGGLEQNEGEAPLERPCTAPPGGREGIDIVAEMRSARELAKKYKRDYAAMQKKVKDLEQKKERLHKIVAENEA